MLLVMERTIPQKNKRPLKRPVTPPSDEEGENFLTVREVLQHMFLMIVLWGLLYFEVQLLVEILDRWADPYYTSGLFGVGGRLPEMIAFALAIVMAAYTVGITVVFFVNIVAKRFRNLNLHRYIRLNTVVLTSFVVYWALFVSLFLRL